MKYPVLALALTLLTNTAIAAPNAFKANYTVSAKGLTLGTMTAVLSYDKSGGYTYQKTTKANGLAALLSGDTLIERSQGQKKGDKLIPQSYLHHHKNKRKDKRDELRFKTPTNVEGNYKNKPYQLTVPQGTVDLAVLELYLMEAINQTGELNYKVAGKGKLRNYSFQKLGAETLQLPAGKYQCAKIKVQHKDNKQQTTLWLAPQLNHLIVQVRHQENNGEIIETRLKNKQIN